MHVDDFYAIRKDLMDEALRVTQSKGADYTTGDTDALKNFKSVAKDLGLTPLQVWGVYAKKHFDAVMAYAKTGGQNESEPIKGRLIDVINYAALFYGLVMEDVLEKTDFKWYYGTND